VDGTTALLDEAIRAGVERFVHVSTVGVYGFDHAENITEDAPWPPNFNLYSTTKQHAEKAVWKVADKMPVPLARPGDVVGPQQYAWTVQFVEKIKQRILLPPTDASSQLNMWKTKTPCAVIDGFRQAAKADALDAQLFDRLDQLLHCSRQPVELPDDKGVAAAGILPVGRGDPRLRRR
jgi:hypothetical protein